MTWAVETAKLTCHRCLGELYLAVRVPHPGFAAPAGYTGTFTRTVPLCPRCDVDDANAHALLAFFAVHSQVDDFNAAQFVNLMENWITNLPPPETVSGETLDGEIAAWRRGEFDGP